MSDSKDSKRCETKLLKYQLALVDSFAKLPTDVCLLIGQFHKNPPKAGDLKQVLKALPEINPCRYCSKPAWRKLKVHGESYFTPPYPTCTGCYHGNQMLRPGGAISNWYESTTWPYTPRQQQVKAVVNQRRGLLLKAKLAASRACKETPTAPHVSPPPRRAGAKFTRYPLP